MKLLVWGGNASVFALSWAWAYLILNTTAQNLMGIQSLKCFPKGSISFNLASDMICASKCFQRRGLAFKYSDGLCDIFGDGLGGPAAQHVFEPMKPPSWPGISEMAQGKPSQSSSDGGVHVTKHANDNSDVTMYHSVTDDIQPWWLLDLEETYLVYAVEVLTRQDCCEWRFHDIEIRIGSTAAVGNDFSGWTLLAFYKGPYTKAEGRLNFTSETGICGRYVVLHKISTDADHLQLLDVKVYADTP